MRRDRATEQPDTRNTPLTLTTRHGERSAFCERNQRQPVKTATRTSHRRTTDRGVQQVSAERRVVSGAESFWISNRSFSFVGEHQDVEFSFVLSVVVSGRVLTFARTLNNNNNNRNIQHSHCCCCLKRRNALESYRCV